MQMELLGGFCTLAGEVMEAGTRILTVEVGKRGQT